MVNYSNIAVANGLRITHTSGVDIGAVGLLYNLTISTINRIPINNRQSDKLHTHMISIYMYSNNPMW